ncbi:MULTISPECIES: hypothetical protein [Arthrobacter]|uniref:Hpt domain-containing protein n=1 Tax=Arthrobacter oryzae TaxID=409290 RepID=A0A3N0C4R7_9MICC|nr:MULTISPECIES: hypothetical protein [Arthrobacter]QYF91143.1 hypothetical protein KY499_08160 [Arthrobacter sp. PAMC25284]RNL57148.1 hypothetical protein D7003_07545 [Arthrobacter oryzae]
MNPCDGLVLDIGRIDSLSIELSSRAYAVGILSRFLERLPGRLGSVHGNLREGQSEGALIAILSVATSAAMTGALQLEAQSREVERQIRAGDLAAARVAAGGLDTNAADFAQQARELFGSEATEAQRSAPEQILQAA